MVDKICLKCGWYDTDYECVCPELEPWQCPLNKEAIAELNAACEAFEGHEDA